MDISGLLLLASVCEKEGNKEQHASNENAMNPLMTSWCYAPKGRRTSDSYNWCVKCQVEGCNSYASFGFHGREFCKKHAPIGTRSFYGSVCETCGRKANYGLAGQKPQRCREHKMEDMRLIRPGLCHLCKERATHGLPLGKKIFCQTHASSHHVLLTYPQCARGNCTRKVAVKGMLCAWHSHK